MKKFVIAHRETEINNTSRAAACYPGVTIDADNWWNHGDCTPMSEEVYTSEEDARKAFSQLESYYSYNGSGYGYASEHWLETYEVPDDDPDDPGELISSEMSPAPNFAEFHKKWADDEDEEDEDEE